MTMSLDEAKNMLTPEAAAKLREVVEPKQTVDASHKVNNDVLMAAFCKAVCTGVIEKTSLNGRLAKLLNSETNTISCDTLAEILDTVRAKQPGISCQIYMTEPLPDLRVIKNWGFTESPISFVEIFAEVLRYWDITPTDVRKKMTQTLKETIVNNVSQTLSRFYKATPEERAKMRISITTIHRLVNMEGGILTAEFVDSAKL